VQIPQGIWTYLAKTEKSLREIGHELKRIADALERQERKENQEHESGEVPDADDLRRN
jgi:hypothetical protein